MKSSLYSGSIQNNFPRNLRTRNFQCSRHRTIFLHRQLTSTFRFPGINCSVEFINDVCRLPQCRFFPLFTFSINLYIKAGNFLLLFFENHDDVNSRATTNGHDQRLHRTNTFVVAADIGTGIKKHGLSFSIFGFKMEGIVETVECDFHGRQMYDFRPLPTRASLTLQRREPPHAQGENRTFATQ